MVSNKSRRIQSAFTFAEVLAAMLFMALVIPVAMKGVQLANRAGVVAVRKGIAVHLADQYLTELILTGNWRSLSPSGNFGREWNGYRWELRQESWREDSAMRQVTLDVYYMVQMQEYNVRLSTLAWDATQ